MRNRSAQCTLAGGVATLLAAIILLAACGGDGSGPPAAQQQQEQSQTQQQPGDLSELGPDLRIPGFAVYTRGVDLVLQEGSQTRVLVEGTERVSVLAPVISPDGQRIAYVTFDQGIADGSGIGSALRLIDLDGNDTALLKPAKTGEFFFEPRWTTDGAALVYTHQLPEFDNAGRFFAVAVERIDVATGIVTVLRDHAAAPDLSPDGRFLIFSDDPALQHRLTLLDLQTGAETVLAGTDDGLSIFRIPRFSPDGEWIAFSASGDGAVASVLGIAPARVMRDVRPQNLRGTNARNGVQDVWRVRPDGSGLQRLTTLLEDQLVFSWSTDGRFILLRGSFGTYVMDVEARATVTLGPGEFHGWHDWGDTLLQLPPAAPDPSA